MTFSPSELPDVPDALLPDVPADEPLPHAASVRLIVPARMHASNLLFFIAFLLVTHSLNTVCLKQAVLPDSALLPRSSRNHCVYNCIQIYYFPAG